MFGLREYFQICASGFAGMSQCEAVRVRRQGAEVVSMAATHDLPRAKTGISGTQIYSKASAPNFMAIFVSAGQHFAVVRGGAVTPDDYQSFGREAIMSGAPALRSSWMFNPLTGDFLGRVSDIAKSSCQFRAACGQEKLQLIQVSHDRAASSLMSHFAMVRHREIAEIDARYMAMDMFTLQLRKVMQDLYENQFSFDALTNGTHDKHLAAISL